MVKPASVPTMLATVSAHQRGAIERRMKYSTTRIATPISASSMRLTRLLTVSLKLFFCSTTPECSSGPCAGGHRGSAGVGTCAVVVGHVATVAQVFPVARTSATDFHNRCGCNGRGTGSRGRCAVTARGARRWPR